MSDSNGFGSLINKILSDSNDSDAFHKIFKIVFLTIFVGLIIIFIKFLSEHENFRALIILGIIFMLALYYIGYYAKEEYSLFDDYYKSYVFVLNLITVIGSSLVYYMHSFIGILDTILGVFIAIFLIIKEFAITRYAVIPQSEKWVIARNGKARIVGPGVVKYHKIFDEIRKKIKMTEQTKPVEFKTLTKDNILLEVKAFVRFQVKDPKKALAITSGFEDWLAGGVKGNLRTQIAELTLDEFLAKRPQVKNKLVEALKKDVNQYVDENGNEVYGKGLRIVLANASEVIIPEEIRVARQNRNLGAMKRGGMQKNAELQKYIRELQADVALKEALNKAEAEKAFIEAVGLSIELIKENGGKVDGEILKDILLGDKYMKAMKAISTSKNAKLIFQPTDIQNRFLHKIDDDLEDAEG